MRRLLLEDINVVAAFTTPVELESAVTRRSAGVSLQARFAAAELIHQLRDVWTIVDDFERIMELALGLAAKHRLRAGDAIQLSSALIVCGSHSEKLPFVTIDDELSLAARAEGFPTLP